MAGGSGDDTLIGGRHADAFVFGVRDGTATISDFTLNEDILLLDTALLRGDLTASQVVDQFAQADGDNVVLDFGTGNMLVLQGLNDTTQLQDQITFA